MPEKKITLSHGSGGKATQRLIGEIFRKYFSNSILDRLEDSAFLPGERGKILFTTDSFVVSPIFFPGGDIGKISICGTVNDLTAMGAIPKYLSISFILEEGFDFFALEKICSSIKKTSREANVKIVTGDTKVVEKGSADKIFITTSGIGFRDPKNNISIYNVKPGDNIIINGSVGDHGLAILNARQDMKFTGRIISDCAPLNNMIHACFDKGCKIRAMRDVTRGGLATVLNEAAEASGSGIEVYENKIPVNRPVRSFCEILGLDPLYLANEGKMVIFAAEKDTEKCLKILKDHKYGKHSAVIGKVSKGRGVFLKTAIGGKRPLITLESDQLPRIC
ncbi:MAG: hydrogenase expression/formation protein HypE [bacterium]|nr:hydrogenase expression/formation protein HypE [bacterium]